MKKMIILFIVVLILTGCKGENYKLNSETTQVKNIITENPIMNQVTNEISEKLIGRYEVIDTIVDYYEDMMYFEIRADGTMEISLHTFSGPAICTEESFILTAFYTDIRTIISFQRITGSVYTFAGTHLSLDFVGNSDCTYFISITIRSDAPNEELKFVKVS